VDPGLPRFVVTGCARSGTLFTASALAALGHPCGHEALFTPECTGVPAFGDARGDVSWLAAPFLDRLPAGTIVVHQVRTPLAAIRSMLGVRMFQTRPHPLMGLRYRLQHYHVRFARPITNPRFVRFAAVHCPRAFEPAREIDRAARYWVDWNRRIEDAASSAGLPYHRVRVEDLDDAALVALDHLLGGRADDREASRILSMLGTETHRARRVPPVTLEDLGDPSLRDELVALATRYGYAP
jgi:hypothetical protein